MARPSEILLIKLGALGDVIRTTCLLEPIRKKYSPCRITWLTAPEALPLLQGLAIEQLWAIGDKMNACLKHMEFDVVMNLDEDSAACAAATFACGKRLIGGYQDKGGKPAYTSDSSAYFDLGLLNHDLKNADALKLANRKTYQRLWAEILGLDLAGYPSGYEPLVAIDDTQREAADGILKITNKPRVGVNLGAGPRWGSKQPSVAKAAEIVKALAGHGYEIILFGGELERARNQEIARLAGAGIDCGVHPLKVFAELIGRCRALVTTDSLALHLACAAATPCVVLFGPTSASEIELYGRGIKLEPKPACACYYRPKCSAAQHCVDMIPASAVVSAVELMVA